MALLSRLDVAEDVRSNSFHSSLEGDSVDTILTVQSRSNVVRVGVGTNCITCPCDNLDLRLELSLEPDIPWLLSDERECTGKDTDTSLRAWKALETELQIRVDTAFAIEMLVDQSNGVDTEGVAPSAKHNLV